VRGLEKVDQIFELTMTAYNLTRMRTFEQIRQYFSSLLSH
jgi:hypothetical protein